MEKRKPYAVGKIGGSKVFKFATLDEAEEKIAAFAVTDPEGVESGDYYLDGPGEKLSPADKQARAKKKSKLTKRMLIDTHPLYLDDPTIEIFDDAVSAAESHLDQLLSRMSPAELVERFKKHVDIHMEYELKGAKRYGNDAEAFRDAVNEGTEPAF